MNYWSGYMNWSLDLSWKCEICGKDRGLTWGMIHAECRCDCCHAVYSMRADDERRSVLTRPRLLLKPAFLESAKTAAKAGKVLDDLTKEEWIALGVPAEQFTEMEEA